MRSGTRMGRVCKYFLTFHFNFIKCLMTGPSIKPQTLETLFCSVLVTKAFFINELDLLDDSQHSPHVQEVPPIRCEGKLRIIEYLPQIWQPPFLHLNTAKSLKIARSIGRWPKGGIGSGHGVQGKTGNWQ